MTHHLNFIPQRVWQPKGVNELISISQEHLEYEAHSSDLSAFQMTQQGTFEGDGLSFRFTEQGFLALCKYLKIPNPFANFITWDLLRDNINRISRNIIDKDATFYFYEDETNQLVCVNVASPKKLAISHVPFLEMLADQYFDIKRIQLDDNTMDIYLANPEDSHIKPIEVKEGDNVLAGLRLRNSTTSYHITEARQMYWRLVCANGLIMPVAEGQVKCRLKRGNDPIPKVQAFMTELQMMGSEMTANPNFRELTDRRLDSIEFSKYWKQIKRITGDAEYVDDFIFAIDEDTRKSYIAEAKVAKKDDEVEAQITPVNVYQLMNNITDKAKDHSFEVTAKMEEAAGKMITQLL